MAFSAILQRTCPRLGWVWIAFLLSLSSEKGHAEQPARILFLVGEAEYHTREALGRFARKLLADQFTARFLEAASNDRADPDCHRFPELEKALAETDLLFLSVRRRFPPADDLRRIRAFIAAGKPVIAIRTSSHAFATRAKGAGYQPPAGHAAWEHFDQEILGIDYQGHYRASKEGEPGTLVSLADPSQPHPVLARIDLRGERSILRTHLYRSVDPDPDLKILLRGRDPASGESQPLAWVRTLPAEKGGSRIFSTSAGGDEDFAERWFQNLLVNAVTWTLQREPKQVNLADPTQHRPKEAFDEPLSPEDATALLNPAEDLSLLLVASEPVVQQPVFFNFDERGRLWVVQYRQYPEPAGLRRVSKDRFWRARYDKRPAPPGHADFIPGNDRISIHEDADHDGIWEKVTVFADDLNLATACLRGDGGVYVLQPPYLLHYPDRDRDDVPDAEPTVVLEGFGIEDTHSLASALCWGPDGWIYGSQGSTVTSAIVVPGSDAPPVHRAGQLIWRYQPQQKRYEVFAEGGGNIWSCEFDSKGRTFAGANGGAPGFHYLQGAYYQKSFGKHGELSNPHAYGYFAGIDHPDFKRVTTSICIPEGGQALPARYDGALVWANPLLGRFGTSELTRDGLGFRAKYLDLPLTTAHRWFRPVYVDSGPDGALFFSDWYDRQVNHYRNHEAGVSQADGRIYRVARKGIQGQPGRSPDLSRESYERLVHHLARDNRWAREQAQRMLVEHPQRDQAVPLLENAFRRPDPQTALEAFWALHRQGKLARYAPEALAHRDPHLRRWAVRLLGDQLEPSLTLSSLLESLAAFEPDLEVRGQLASTAKRLPRAMALPILINLLGNPHDADDPHQPLLIWWGLEAQCHDRGGAEAVTDLFLQNPRLGIGFGVQERLVRRLATAYPRLAVRLIEGSPDSEPLVASFERAWSGRSLATLPPEAAAVLLEHSSDPLPLRLQLGQAGAFEQARRILQSAEVKGISKKTRILQALGVRPVPPDWTDLLVQQFEIEDQELQIATLGALAQLPQEQVAISVAPLVADLKPEVREVAVRLLASRPSWRSHLVELDRPDLIPADLLDSLAKDDDTALAQMASTHLASIVADKRAQAERTRVQELLGNRVAPAGDPARGRIHFQARCGTCHRLHGKGGETGPDLTAYSRDSVDSLLTAIFDPSFEIREGYGTVVVKTRDGRILSGFLTRETDTEIALRPAAGAESRLPRAEIVSLEKSPVSIMPANLLAGLRDTEVRDFFAYLQHSQPLNLKTR